MALHSKKLHVRKAGVVTDIDLYTTMGETGNSALTIRDGGTTAYAKLGAATDALASPLRVRKNGETFAVLKSAVKPGVAPLFAFGVDNYNDYTTISVAAIYGDRTLSSTTYSWTQKRIEYYTSPAIVSFLDCDDNRRLLVSNRGGKNYSSYVIDPFSSSWPNSNSSYSMNPVCDIDKLSIYMYAVGYNGIQAVDSAYRSMRSYTFPSIGIAVPSGHSVGAEKVLCVKSDIIPAGMTQAPEFVYVLFNIVDDTSWHWAIRRTNSYIVKYSVNLIGGLLYMNYVELEKGSRTWQHFGKKLYICCDGNRSDAGNSCLQIVGLSDLTGKITDNPIVTVPKPAIMNGYFRDITIADSNHVYVILGKQDGYNSYTAVYHTNIDAITEPALWSKVFETTINSGSARYWGIYNDSGKLYAVGSNSVHIFDSLPTGFVNPTKTLTLSSGTIDTFAQIT